MTDIKVKNIKNDRDHNGIDTATTFDKHYYIKKSLYNVYDFSKRKLFSFYGYIILVIVLSIIIIIFYIIFRKLLY